MLKRKQGRKQPEMILLGYQPHVLKELLKIVPDPASGIAGISQSRFAELCIEAAKDLGLTGYKISQKTVSNYVNDSGFSPDDNDLTVMGKVLGVTFVSDWAKSLPTEITLKTLKAIHAAA